MQPDDIVRDDWAADTRAWRTPGTSDRVTIEVSGRWHQLTDERAACLALVLDEHQRHDFAKHAHAIASEAARRPPALEMVAQIAPELRAWIRDNFTIES